MFLKFKKLCPKHWPDINYIKLISLCSGIGRSTTKTIFDILNKFTNTEIISLYDNGLNKTPIPSNAFTKLKRLKRFEVRQQQFSRISSGAFNVDNIENIEFFWTNISVIEDNAFFTQKTSDNGLVLNLMDNPLLCSETFADKAFSYIHKPNKLYLGHYVPDNDYWKTCIKYLPEKTFLPFLQISDKNRLVLNWIDDYHLDCNDCRNAWLKNNPNELKKVNEGYFALQYDKSNKKLDDNDNFKNCTIFYWIF